MKIQGTGVAIVTPFEGYKIDFKSLGKVIDFVILGGVNFIVPLGSTGEASTLAEEEQRAILDFTIEHVEKRVKIVAGNFGGNDTVALGRKIKAWHFDGIDAILSSSPSYNKPTQKGIIAHYKYLAQMSDIPIIIYNVPSRTASNIEAETLLSIAHSIPQVIAVKEASTDLIQIKKIIDSKPPDFTILSGDDPTTLEILKLGGDGVISVIANAYPGEFSKMTEAALNKNWEEAQRIHDALSKIHPHLYIEGNPAGIKAVLSHMGLCKKDVRLPLLPMSHDAYKSMVDDLL